MQNIYLYYKYILFNDMGIECDECELDVSYLSYGILYTVWPWHTVVPHLLWYGRIDRPNTQPMFFHCFCVLLPIMRLFFYIPFNTAKNVHYCLRRTDWTVCILYSCINISKKFSVQFGILDGSNLILQISSVPKHRTTVALYPYRSKGTGIRIALYPEIIHLINWTLFFTPTLIGKVSLCTGH